MGDWLDDLRDPQPGDDEPARGGLSFDDDTAFPTFGSGPTATATPRSGFDDALFGDEPAKPPESGGSDIALGMTSQQRMILSIFLFLDVSVLSCAFLLAFQKIALP